MDILYKENNRNKRLLDKQIWIWWDEKNGTENLKPRLICSLRFNCPIRSKFEMKKMNWWYLQALSYPREEQETPASV